MTGVGDSGMTLSGGQKARIALARAVYQDKQIYLFDDIMSAVDMKVAKHIFQQCVMGYLKHKTRILCTHHVQYLTHADRIILMENGSVKLEGKPVEVLSNVDDFLPIDLELEDSTASSVNTTITDSIRTEATVTDNDSLLSEEFKESGSIHSNVYVSYWKAMGFMLTVSILLALFLMQTSRNMSDWWLSFWVTAATNTSNSTNVTGYSYINQFSFDMEQRVLMSPRSPEEEDPVKHYLIIYGVFAGLNSLFTLIRAFLFAYGGITAASKIHKLLLKSIMKVGSNFKYSQGFLTLFFRRKLVFLM